MSKVQIARRLVFYHERIQRYRQRYGDRIPTRATLRRWVKVAQERFPIKEY